MSNLAKVTLVLGGARSGKSCYAESLMAALQPPWVYVATAEAGDAEMAERIAAHRERRGPNWRTIEALANLDRVLADHRSEPVLVDCLTLWLSKLLLDDGALEDEMVRVEKSLLLATAPKMLVSNEVGAGIVPEHPLGRRFRDLQGVLNQRVAAIADRVVLMVAGLPLVVKGSL